MKMSFRWYGDSDPVTLEKIAQIPGMYSIVSAIYDVPVGEVWSEEKIKELELRVNTLYAVLHTERLRSANKLIANKVTDTA